MIHAALAALQRRAGHEAVPAVLLGSLCLTAPVSLAASFGTQTIPDQTFGLPGSGCSGAYTATIDLDLPLVQAIRPDLTYKLEGVLPSGLAYDQNDIKLTGTLAADLRQASAVSHTLTWTATDSAGSDSLTFEIAIVDERPALEALYASTRGANWTTNTNWAADIPDATCLEDLHGVTLRQGYAAGQVFALDLSRNNLAGPIPGDLEHLHTMNRLDLSHNSLTGPIPEDLGHLHDLGQLDLSHNRLTGSIPENLGKLHFLRRYDLSHNSLTGSIPEDWDASDIAHGDDGHLEEIDLSNNKLTGSIPEIAHNLLQLQTLSLSHNNLTGPIPGDLLSMVLLTSLELSHNNLTGPIPSELDSLTQLDFLILNNNRLSGSIPAAFPTGLIRLDLSHNQLSGDIPEGLPLSFGSYNVDPEIDTIDFSHNRLTGPIPEFFEFMGSVNTFDLSHNQLSGGIPDDLSLMLSLIKLDLSHNRFTGALPSMLPFLLQKLHLHNNGLSGAIPADWGGIGSALEFLSLYDNPPGRTSSSLLYSYPQGMNTNDSLHLLVPNTGYRMCLYGDEQGGSGPTACTIPTKADKLRLVPYPDNKGFNASWSPVSDPAPSGYEFEYRPSTDDLSILWTSVQVTVAATGLARATISGLTPGRPTAPNLPNPPSAPPGC